MSQSSRSGTRWAAPVPRKASRELRNLVSRGDVWSRVGICLLAATVIYVSTSGWAPAFPYRYRQHLPRSLNARVEFEVDDLEATRQAREAARGKISCLYENDARLLQELRQAVIDAAFAVLEKPPEEARETAWQSFWPAASVTEPDAPRPEATLESLERFREALAGDEKLGSVRAALEKAFLEYDQNGLLDTLQHELGQGSMREIRVYPRGNLENAETVLVTQVRIPEIAEELRKRIANELKREDERITDPAFVAERLFAWMRPKIPGTLTLNAEASRNAADAAALAVEKKKKRFQIGERLLNPAVESGEFAQVGGMAPLSESDLGLLRREHAAMVAQMGWTSRLVYSLIFLGLFVCAFGLIAGYLWHRDRQLVTKLRAFSGLVFAFAVVFCMMWFSAMDMRSRLEIIPLVLFAMTVALAWHVELAIFLAALVSLVFTLAHGFDLSEFVVLAAAGCVSAMFCRSIRSRTKSVYIGLITAATVFPVTLCSELLLVPHFTSDMLVDGLWYAGGAGAAGLLMTALLPFLERWFGIQTDISLLELSDPNHILLRQLVQRAPGTYNHSINVASIAEAAADAIGANGLLCRVGAYFHDIGKMRKPEYFVENQAGGENRHDDLVPTMSTLVIISHVKDGTEMARQHHLPQRIIDMIEQHHGTTLVEYFFMRAAEKSEDEHRVDDSSFRYPGPRPQTAEAAVLMLADSVEGATRTLREPAPSRIENLVSSITQKKVDDGQFDECPLTLQQIRSIESSLVKSLNAMYHARVRYPEQAPA